MDLPVSELTGLTLKDLIDSGLHFGHQTKRWNPKMRDYIFDKRNGIHIVDLTQTVPMLEEAAKFLRDTVLSGKKVLFVATKKQAQEAVKEAAESCGQFYMTERWLGGTLTNNQTIRHSVKRMRQIETMGRNNNGVLSVHKKEASSLRRELDKLHRNLGGIADMTKMPGAIFIIDICREQNALKEALRLNIPVVALVDTNADPDPIDYIIPGNDDAVRGIKLIADAFAKVIKAANDEYAQIAAEKQRMKEAEKAKEEAANRATRKSRKEAAASSEDSSEKAKAKLNESRKRAARAAKEAVEAKVASVETAKPKTPEAEKGKTADKKPAAKKTAEKADKAEDKAKAETAEVKKTAAAKKKTPAAEKGKTADKKPAAKKTVEKADKAEDKAKAETATVKKTTAAKKKTPAAEKEKTADKKPAATKKVEDKTEEKPETEEKTEKKS
ncbi:MAG: 30S ribosomal protein S2 [Kiritimatiellia bacterium]